ncbi:MAG: hypothetical protein GC161_14110 [Planctomycetaceae bacterium]|nr:hypothetical protein [Planctomycetaceae bacterium]
MPDWLPKELTLQTGYALCAGLGIVVVVLQLLLGLFGGDDGDPSDGDFDFEGDGGLDVLTVRGIASFLTVFGLVGWIGTLEGWPRPVSLIAALVSGILVLLSVALILRMQRRLSSTGTVVASRAVGSVGRVYLRIPAAKGGVGKVTVEIQGRTAEYSAFTKGRELTTGTDVRVVRMTTPGTFEVAPLEENP